MSLQDYARRLGGEVSGGWIRCPGPGHSPKDRSLSVRIDPSDPDNFTVYSFAGDRWQDCKDHVRSRLNLGTKPSQFRKRQKKRHSRARSTKTELAKQIWSDGLPAQSSPIEQYLTCRGLALVPELVELRFHSNCPFPAGRAAVMLAPMTHAVTTAFQGVHRTRLSPKDKAMLGPSKSAVVRLSADEDITNGLHICEGIETGIALLSMGFRPLWCTLSAIGLRDFPVLKGIESLTVFADHDASGTGDRVARICAARWQNAGREARIYMTPEAGTDFADYSGAS